MAKLFALEESELENDVAELKVSPEEGEAADVELGVQEDVADSEEQAEAIDEGIEAADQLEEVQELVKDSVENGEGLNPVAAEAVRIAVEAICTRIGANPKSVYTLYATENFKSASSRKANTAIALEGIGDFLKNLWEKIKASLSSLWDKITAFWNKHISNLGRLLKALEASKNKAAQLKGNPTLESVEVPSSLRNVFPTTGSLDVDKVKKYLTNVSNLISSSNAANTINTIYSFTTELVNATQSTSSIKDEANKVYDKFGITNNGLNIVIGTVTDCMPGGHYTTINLKVEEEGTPGDEEYKLSIDEDSGVVTNDNNKNKLEVANKDKIKDLLTATIAMVKEAIKYNSKVTNRAKTTNDNIKKINNFMTKSTATDDIQAVKRVLKGFYALNTQSSKIESKIISYVVSGGRGSLIFANACMKNHVKM
jgi:hypothetical protein